MTNFELEEMGLKPLHISEMNNMDGGLILGNFNLIKDAAELVKFAVGEVADFGQGVYDGFTHFIK